jgi:hypothetical protein
VPYVSPIDILRRLLASPAARDAGDGDPLFVFADEDKKNRPQEFVDTPIAREYLKYRRMCSFVHRGNEVQVGDFLTDGGRTKIYQIHSMDFEPNSEAKDAFTLPRLYLLCKPFVEATYLEEKSHIPIPGIRVPNEFIGVHFMARIPFLDHYRVITNNVNNEECPDGPKINIEFSHQHGGYIPFVRLTPHFDVPCRSGTNVAWILAWSNPLTPLFFCYCNLFFV